MTPLRMGVACAVHDDAGHILLSLRGDLNIWNLPGGRLDLGESLEDAAIREVREETGLIIKIERAVGLYYLAGWGRLNILYAGWRLGGELLGESDETRANRYFNPDKLPNMLWPILPLDSAAGTRHLPRVITTPPHELRRVKSQLRWRWIWNLLGGRPEPRFPVFQVTAVGLVWDDDHTRVLTVPTSTGYALLRVECDGQTAPWLQLLAAARLEMTSVQTFRWVGLWEDTAQNRIELVFATTVEENQPIRDAEWSIARNVALPTRDRLYVEQVKPRYHLDPVWSLDGSSYIEENDTIVIGERT
ncbi:MAG: NUDIX domain-containing protein [Anaerolineae bacterium]